MDAKRIAHGRILRPCLALLQILLLSCLLLPACATSDEGKPINFSLTAKQNYERGLAELKNENYPEALRYFTYVKQKFPFSKYAALAELAAADTEFGRGSYQEAIDGYKSFLRLHRSTRRSQKVTSRSGSLKPT